MGDPLSVAASIITVLQLSAQVFQYLKDVKGGTGARVRLRDELRNTINLLEMLKDRVDNIEDREIWAKSILSLGSQNGPLDQFADTLKLLNMKLTPESKLKKSTLAIMWPFNERDIENIFSSLERQKALFGLALQNDSFKLSQVMHSKLTEVTHRLEDIQLHQEDQKRQILDQSSMDILDWMSSFNYMAKQSDILSQRQENTGLWILEREEFVLWMRGQQRCLWCPGIPGAGKTVLASIIIQYLEQTIQSSDVGLAYIYCDYRNSSDQGLINLISDICSQLLKQRLPLAGATRSLLERHKQRKTRPSLTELSQILNDLTPNFKTIYVVVDALDECAERDGTRDNLVSEILKLGASVQLLCTSRPLSDIERIFAQYPKLIIQAENEDVKIYLKARINREARLKKHVLADPKLEKDITTAIISKVKGMFLLARLHIESLTQKHTRKAIRQALDSLPKGLEDVYEEIIARIRSQGLEDRLLAERVLSLIASSPRPLTVMELRHAIAAMDCDEDDAKIDATCLPEEEIITTVCGGIVSIESESHVIRLVHYTTQQYLRSRQKELFPDSSLTIAKACITYLMLENFSSGVCDDDYKMQDRLQDFPFIQFASSYWGTYVTLASEKESWTHVQALLNHDNAMQIATQARNIPEHRYKGWSQGYPRMIPKLVFVADFNLPLVIEALLAEPCGIDDKGSDGRTALIVASKAGNEKIVEQLINAGADVNAIDAGEESALSTAAGLGYERVVDVLLEAKAIAQNTAWTPLRAAAASGHYAVVLKLLQSASSDTNFVSNDKASALRTAISGGHESTARVLLAHDAKLDLATVTTQRTLAIAKAKGYTFLVDEIVNRNQGTYKRFIPALLQSEPSLTSRFQHLEGSGMKTDSSNKLETSGEIDSIDDDLLVSAVDAFKGLHITVGRLSQRYRLAHQLGEGFSSKVYQCTDNITGELCAVKIFDKFKRRDIARIRNEVAIMHAIRHPNVLEIRNLLNEDDRIYMILDLAVEGELFDWIVSNKKLSESETRRVFLQLFQAVEYLHDRKIVHRDIKPENVLLVDKQLTLKLADFGGACNMNDEGKEYLTDLLGTPSYVAPEILQHGSVRRYSYAVDVWSLGVVLYICLCGFPPFSDELYTTENPYNLAQQIKQARFDYPSPYWDDVGDPALELIDRMLTANPEQRITVGDCLNHPWLTMEPPELPKLIEHTVVQGLKTEESIKDETRSMESIKAL